MQKVSNVLESHMYSKDRHRTNKCTGRWGGGGAHAGRVVTGEELFGQEGMHILDVLVMIAAGRGGVCVLPLPFARSLTARMYTRITYVLKGERLSRQNNPGLTE